MLLHNTEIASELELTIPREIYHVGLNKVWIPMWCITNVTECKQLMLDHICIPINRHGDCKDILIATTRTHMYYGFCMAHHLPISKILKWDNITMKHLITMHTTWRQCLTSTDSTTMHSNQNWYIWKHKWEKKQQDIPLHTGLVYLYFFLMNIIW